MATTKSATYKIFNGTDWDTYYFKTSASQVGELSSLKFIRPSTNTVNGKSFFDSSGNAQAITLTATDISYGNNVTVYQQLLNVSNTVTSVNNKVNGLTGADIRVSADNDINIDEAIEYLNSALITENDVNTAINTAINNLIGGADSAYDTLKEIQELMKADDTAAAAMLADINTLKTNVGNLDTKLTTLTTSHNNLKTDLQADSKSDAFVVSWANKANFDSNGRALSSLATTTSVDTKIEGFRRIFYGGNASSNTNLPNAANSTALKQPALSSVSDLIVGDIWIQY